MIIIRFFLSLLFYLFHIKQGLFIRWKGIDLNHKKIIVTFTTIPSRFSGIQSTLKSLYKQTLLPDEIVIAIPDYSTREKKEYRIPQFIKKYNKIMSLSGMFVKTPVITVLKSKKDWGPATKYIPVLMREKQNKNDSVLIVIDDDQVYQKTMVSNLIKHHIKYPESVLCNRGRKLSGDYKYGNSKIIIGPKIDSFEQVDFITGVGGYLLNPCIITEDLWNYDDAPDGAFYMDDIWISGYLSKNNIQRLVIPAQSELLYKSKRDRNRSRIYRSNKSQKKTITLSDIPCKEGTEDPREYYNNEVILFFKLYW